ncbi:hypothetical protein HHK36_011074 [Tetracentron sinense]|uniref:Protein YIP n=1 Tax=Tetracentron sinense TaxID=13715 RepID=A0A834ZFJ2_TETSI|nr:hypothetical protein HHK36_011074 [Tetracentron sinense]
MSCFCIGGPKHREMKHQDSENSSRRRQKPRRDGKKQGNNSMATHGHQEGGRSGEATTGGDDGGAAVAVMGASYVASGGEFGGGVLSKIHLTHTETGQSFVTWLPPKERNAELGHVFEPVSNLALLPRKMAAVTNGGESTSKNEVPEANLKIFPPNNGGDRGRGYQVLGSLSEGDEQHPTNSWKGVFSISSYTQYFDVDGDVVLDRIMSSLYPIGGDFFRKIDANPDLYGLIWISTTLVFVIASLGNCATYMMRKRNDHSTSWSFDVSYVNLAACAVYGYALVVPVAFYFLLQYLGSNTSLVRLWCMWGYSLFVFIISSFLLVIPVEILRWIIIILAGVVSACFVALNIKSYIERSDLTLVLVASFILQLALALFIKILFFP